MKKRFKRGSKTRVVQPSRTRTRTHTYQSGGLYYPFDISGWSDLGAVTSSNATCSTDESGYGYNDAGSSSGYSGSGYSGSDSGYSGSYSSGGDSGYSSGSSYGGGSSCGSSSSSCGSSGGE